MKKLSINILLATSLLVSAVSAFADMDSATKDAAQLSQEIESATKSLEAYRRGKGSRPEHFEKYRLLLIELYEQKLSSHIDAQKEVAKLGGYDLKAEAAARKQIEIDVRLNTLEGVKDELERQKQLAQTYSDDSLRRSIINNNIVLLNWTLLNMTK
ncbi:MAG: hypothetical protein AABY53_06060 [Bdellovibrionota bacterium]